MIFYECVYKKAEAVIADTEVVGDSTSSDSGEEDKKIEENEVGYIDTFEAEANVLIGRGEK